ncbi:MAG: M20 family metallopeptidase [Bacteroidetes bacterium]|nr:M20 family metallopeptidase [Bacteroidota bacterium]
MSLSDKIKQTSQEIFEEVKANRRHLHQHPELSFQEFETQKFVRAALEKIGIEDVKDIAGTGLIAEIKGKEANTALTCLRADLDALPIQEKNTTEYTSCNAGIMHACGHDVHTSSLLGAAKILHQLKDEFTGTVRLIFQPGEEKLPGGASMVIKEGGLANPTPKSIIGQHVMPELEAGKIGFRKGIYMASTDEIYITVKGKGGHGAMPHQNIDPIVIASHLIVNLQQVVSRWAKPDMPTVLSFGKIIGNGATNVIPDEVTLEGTFRTFNEEWRMAAHDKIKSLCKNLVEGMGGKVEVDIRVGYPFLKNDEKLTGLLQAAAAEYMGASNIVDLDMRTTAEDFAFYTHVVPGCFYRLGVGNAAKSISAPVHNPHFDIDEDALKHSTGLMAWLAINSLK